MLSETLIEQILSRLPFLTIGVLGDLFLDRYLEIDGGLDEPSIETGLVAYQVTRVRSLPGALGTIINNLAALGVGRIYPIAIIGDDGEGYELRQALAKMPSVVQGGIGTWPDRRTPTYTKPMYRERDHAPRELNRLDIKNHTPTPHGAESMILDLLDEAWPQFDALLVLDQVSAPNTGVITTRIREKLGELGEREPSKFIMADSRELISQFRNVCVKPNADEIDRAIEIEAIARQSQDPLDHFELRLVEMARRVGRTVFCTLGGYGIQVRQPDVGDPFTAAVRAPGYPVFGPIDPVGAGDSTSAGIACAVASGLTDEQAAAFGNLVASITIQQIGTTGTATPDQVRERWQQVKPGKV